MIFGKGEGVSGVTQIRAGNYELRTSDFTGSSDNGIEIIGMSFFAMVFSSEDGIGKVDTNLLADVMC